MATCLDKITKNITSTCLTQGIAGTEVKAWIGNRKDLASVNYDVVTQSLITAMAFQSSKRIYTLTGVKNLINPGFSVVTTDDRANRWLHKLIVQIFEQDAESQENIDSLEDVFVIVEMKDKKGDNSTFRVFGIANGLFITSDEWASNDIDGARSIELGSLELAPEPFSKNNFFNTDYSTTLSAIVALETPAV